MLCIESGNGKFLQCVFHLGSHFDGFSHQPLKEANLSIGASFWFSDGRSAGLEPHLNNRENMNHIESLKLMGFNDMRTFHRR